MIVASGNSDKLAPFITDQVDALISNGLKIEYLLIRGKGIMGYLKNFKLMLEKINMFQPDLIHAHYGLSGLFSSLQRKVPVITTFHGSDINVHKARYFSKIAMRLSKKSIFVSHKLAALAKAKNAVVIPCGVDMNVFYPIEKAAARKQLNLTTNKIYLLFSSSFSNQVKNYPLAKNAVDLTGLKDLEIVELKGFNRSEVALLMNAVDAVLLTSFSEGSPQFIKEAMACNTPIISTDVGDIKEVVNQTKGCFVSKDEAEELAVNIKRALNFGGRTIGRDTVAHFDNKLIAKELVKLYHEAVDMSSNSRSS